MVFFIAATEKSDPLFASGINGTSNTKSSSEQQSKSTDAKKDKSGSLRVESGDDPLFSEASTETKRVSKTDAKRKSTSNNKPLFDDDEQKYVCVCVCVCVRVFIALS